MLMEGGYVREKEIETATLLFKKILKRKVKLTKKLRFYGEKQTPDLVHTRKKMDSNWNNPRWNRFDCNI